VPAAGSQMVSSGVRLGQLDHERDDMTRPAELPVLAGGCDLAEHVIVDVALGVAVAHIERIKLLHDLVEQRGAGDLQPGVAHVARTGRAVPVEGT